MSRGRKQTTGRFETRAELEAHVWFLWRQTSCGETQIAKNCEVSSTTVANILKRKSNGTQ